MSLKEKLENLLNKAKEKIEELKRKHMIENIEPKDLREMISTLKEDIEYALSIENEAERKEVIKEAEESLAEVEGIVDDVLKSVEKKIEESVEGLNSWLSREAHAQDLKGLNRGKALLLSMKEELGKLKGSLNGKTSPEQDEQNQQNEPGNE